MFPIIYSFCLRRLLFICYVLLGKKNYNEQIDAGNMLFCSFFEHSTTYFILIEYSMHNLITCNRDLVVHTHFISRYAHVLNVCLFEFYFVIF